MWPMNFSAIHFLLVCLEPTSFRTHFSTETVHARTIIGLQANTSGQFSVLLGHDLQYPLKKVIILDFYKYHILLVFFQRNLLFFPVLFAGSSSSSLQ